MRILSWIMAVYFLVGSCFPGADFSQLPKVANLNAHFQLHRDLALLEGEDLSFSRFLSIHFFKPQRHSDQHRPQDHHELPLQSVHSSVLDQCPSQLLELTALLAPVDIDAPSFHFLHSYSGEYTGSIFQPPINALFLLCSLTQVSLAVVSVSGFFQQGGYHNCLPVFTALRCH